MLTYLLIALSVIVTVASMTPGDRPGSFWYQLGNFGYVSPEAIWGGRYWGLITPVFIHGGWVHLLFNMIWMYQIGRILEGTLNQALYLLFLVAAAAVGSACEILVSGSPGIGMSGVVYAMFGLMWAGRGAMPVWGAIATRQNLLIFVGWGLFCVVATEIGLLQVANGAHGGGILFGLCIGGLFFSRRRWLWAVPLALLLTLSVMAVTWVPWSRNWDFWKGNQEFDRGRYTQAIHWYQASLKRGGDPHANWANISASWGNIADQEKARGNATGAAQALSQAGEADVKAGPDRQDQ